MANTYTQLYTHFVFAVKHREALLNTSWDEKLRTYITGIVQNHGHKVIAINNMPDHLHLFAGLNPNQSISELMKTVKGDSSEWINKERFTKGKFQWQQGYGAFTHSRSQIKQVGDYVEFQQVHHKKISFLDEYRKMLKDFQVEYDDRFLFTEPI
jgi:putative transposase